MHRVILPFIWSMLASAPLCLRNANKWVENGWMQTFFLWTTKHVFVHFYLQPPHTWIHQQEHKVLHIMWSRCTATVYCVVTQCQSTPTCLLCKMFVSTALKLWLWGIYFLPLELYLMTSVKLFLLNLTNYWNKEKFQALICYHAKRQHLRWLTNASYISDTIYWTKLMQTAVITDALSNNTSKELDKRRVTVSILNSQIGW